MPLIYALAARGSVVLAEHSDMEGNFPTVTRLLLCKLPTGQKEKMSYVYDRYIFHYMVVRGITFLTMADDAAGFALPFAFLEDFAKSFLAMYGATVHTAIALAMQNSYGPRLKDLMDSFNENHQAEAMGRLRMQIDGIHNVLIDNIDKILQRGERIDILVDQSERLNQESVQFRRQARRLKNAVWWRSVRVGLMFLLLVATLGTIIGMISCGGVTFPSCRNS
ncbi:vesicle-associated membrane protein, putative [Toxoplasma gondii ME49]|uniref:Vesicle-associated membrane protein, putative n=16 Tax=Toxoplasma gondii TaxID=5811 RepID=A0A125YLL7_TOXGM|nr:vesicle-associated membrane protein, putative [Toxoplasma gondii ME49]EPR64155.1 putative vesicle-associated membrane protein [Toxoplasma gondii GT1]ESS35649.1 putative vesicle-associated membrane protein [Toxoplasma gondii VEG]KAF4641670.1 putative vesicle-associated membrane protein [Toxoplasma gondii]EPT29024.1 vesicle-associated membrane protein, putative [Toxoplasma gondii ME49]CEL74770.1 TPA: Vesicle-associated membrane protein 7B [Toxoplasma gondii VEG]|eukprot:XP_018636887.1 vesicle-associated membrane protein, putative [Toxoplasma gondii ME49]